MEAASRVVAIAFFFTLFNCPPLPISSFLPTPWPHLHSFRRLDLMAGIGPESLAFDFNGGGPYTGISDGRVVKWDPTKSEWVEFAATSSNRRKEDCDGSQDPQLENMCGRPLGLQFCKLTGDLFIADAYYGLLSVGPNGGLATQLATGAQGKPFGFTNALDINQENGLVYFTDSSTQFHRRDYIEVILTQDRSGRLMEYNPKTKRVRVLLEGLQFPNGVALSADGTFLLVIETTTCRILRFWLQGPRAGTHQVFMELIEIPDNIRRNSMGEFWVGINSNPLNMKAQTQAPLPSSYSTNVDFVMGMKINSEGQVLQALYSSDDARSMGPSVSEVHEKDGMLYIGSLVMSYVGINEP